MVSYTTFSARTLKWWKRVFLHVFSLAVLNAYILHKATNSDRVPMLQRQFRKQLVKLLIQSVEQDNVRGMCRNPVGRPTKTQDPIQRLQDKHFPSKILGMGTRKIKTEASGVCEPAEIQVLMTM